MEINDIFAKDHIDRWTKASNDHNHSPTTRSSIPSPNSLPPPITAGWHSYTNSTYGISLLYPPD